VFLTHMPWFWRASISVLELVSDDTRGVSWIKHTSSGDGCSDGENSHGENGSDDGGELHFDGWEEVVLLLVGRCKLLKESRPATIKKECMGVGE
jgi:hypothetical protein